VDSGIFMRIDEITLEDLKHALSYTDWLKNDTVVWNREYFVPTLRQLTQIPIPITPPPLVRILHGKYHTKITWHSYCIFKSNTKTTWHDNCNFTLL
jgi:hypothetical protein